MNLLTNRRGSVAFMAALMAPVMVMAVAMGIEVTSWSVTQVEQQRIADAAAWAGATQYIATQTPQTATSTAADLAEINGVSGASFPSTRTWNSTLLIMSDNMITAQVVSGVRNAADTAIEVTVQQNVAKSISLIFPSAQSFVTIKATAIAEIMMSAGGGPQPCLVALQPAGNGVTDDITLSGSADVTSSGCSVRSNSAIALSGTTTINVDGTYAAGVITVGNSAHIIGGTYQTSGAIYDPYASDAVLQNALSSLAAGTTPGPVNKDPKVGGSTTTTLSPGTYAALTVSNSGNVTFNPGTYYVQGNITFQGNAIVTGNNVTFVSLGTLSDANSATAALTAPTTASGQGIPGIVFASTSTGSSQFSGSVSFPLTGVLYFPNGKMTFGGSAATDTTAACSEVVAGTITITGSSTLSTTGCKTYGTVPFGSLPGTWSIVLVQ